MTSPRKDPRDHARDRKQRRLHLALIFECTFHRLIACVKLFLFSTVLPNITFLKIGFIVVQWENENGVSVVNEKKVDSAVELKEGTQGVSTKRRPKTEDRKTKTLIFLPE